MVRQTIKQLWAQKRANGWIFFELVLVFVLGWLVIDPIYIIQYQRKAISNGFEPKDMYAAQIAMYSAQSHLFDSTRNSIEALNSDFKQVVNLVKDYPGVEAVAVFECANMPWGGAWMSNTVMNPEDSSIVYVQHFSYLAGYDIFKVFRFTSAVDHTWETLSREAPLSGGFYITKDAKKAIFEDGPAVGRTVRFFDKNVEVTGVLDYIKSRSSMQPHPIALNAITELDMDDFLWGGPNIIIRVKPGIKQKTFLREFQEQMSTKLKIGNFYLDFLKPYNDFATESEQWDKTAATLRLQSALAAFFLIVIFLGVVSTFWLRVETRKGEIGLKMAVGSTGRKIRRQFLVEGWLLVLFSAAVGIVIQANIIYLAGPSSMTSGMIPEAWPVNNVYAHFTFVSLIVLLLLLVTVTIGTIIPSTHAAKIRPADALRDE